jgi:hypothetical protein
MTETRDRDSLPGSALWMLRSLEPQARPVAERITRQVQEAVPELAGPPDGTLYNLIFGSVHGATRLFLDRALGRETSDIAVDNRFQKLGYRTAALGGSRDVIDQGLRIAVGEIWDELRVRAADNELSAGALNAITEEVARYIEHLADQVQIGFDAGTTARDQDSGVARARLVDCLLEGADADEIEWHASIAGWVVPDEVTVIAVQVKAGQSVDGSALSEVALTRSGSTPQVVICPAACADEIVKQIRAAVPRTRVAVCWPVVPGDVPAAWRWTHRALALVRAKVIPARPVVDCARHRTEIWLHAEPVLRRQLAQELLEPLLGETANSREILSETLLVWLEVRESAPTIATHLGVHPQTVRYRWRRINELFGDRLHDRDYVVQLTLVLKASVPLWLAGDQSDFERYQTSQTSQTSQAGEKREAADASSAADAADTVGRRAISPPDVPGGSR